MHISPKVSIQIMRSMVSYNCTLDSLILFMTFHKKLVFKWLGDWNTSRYLARNLQGLPKLRHSSESNVCPTHPTLHWLSLAASRGLFPSHLRESYPYFGCSQWCHLHQVHCSESKHSSCQHWKRMNTISAVADSPARRSCCHARKPVRELGASTPHRSTSHVLSYGLGMSANCYSGELCLMARQRESQGFGKKGKYSSLIKAIFRNGSLIPTMEILTGFQWHEDLMTVL